MKLIDGADIKQKLDSLSGYKYDYTSSLIRNYTWNFHLSDDKEYSDVIILLRSSEDIRCKYCKDLNGVDVMKLIVPLYDITNGRLVFWERSRFMINQFDSIFAEYSDLTKFVFRITRHGARYNPFTEYEIHAMARNLGKSYEEIYDEWHSLVPEKYEGVLVCPYGIKAAELEITVDDLILTPLICSCCGASLDRKTMACNFCGTHFVLNQCGA